MYVVSNVRHIEWTSHLMYATQNTRHIEYKEQYVESRRYHDGGDEGLSGRSLTAHVWRL